MAKVRNDDTPVAIEDLSGGSTIARFATSTLLDDLTGAELVVLVRLMRVWHLDGPSPRVRNLDLHTQPNTARVALAGLVRHGLIKIKRGERNERYIERRK